MTQAMEFRANGQLDPDLSDPATKTLHADKLKGRWLNTDSATQGVAEIVIDQEGDHFCEHPWVGESGPVEWPRTKARPLANLEEEAGQRALAFAVDFDFEFMAAATYLRVNKGVLVIVDTILFWMGHSGPITSIASSFIVTVDLLHVRAPASSGSTRT